MGHEHGWVEFVVGGFANRNRIVTVDKAKLNGERNDCYRSLFRFSEGLDAYVRRTGSAAGYKGSHTSECLFFDFDCAEDLEAVKNEVVSFILAAEVRYEIPPEYWRIAFSGAKGFHASLPIKVCGEIEASDDFSEIYRAVCCELVSGFKYADTSVYSLNRIIRVPGSINAKTGLFKIPLSFLEMSSFSIEAIREIARRERTLDGLPIFEIDPLPSMVALWQKHARGAALDQECIPQQATTNEELFAPAEQGSRNTKAISIAGRLIQLGVKEAEAVSIITLWNRQNREPLSEAEVQQLVRGAYKRYAQNSLDEPVEVFTLHDAEKEYERIVDTPENEKVKFCLPSIDKRVRSFSAGMVCSVVAKSSNGKSSFVQSVLINHARRSNRPVIFFSLEMPLSLVYERIIQAETGTSGSAVELEYKTNREAIKQKSAIIQRKLNNFYVCTKSGVSLDDITQTVKYVERRTGAHVSLIAIDYLSLLGGKGRDAFERASVNALGMKQLAKALSLPVIFLAQTTKSNTIYDRLDENAGKDAGSILEASDFQFTLWREQEDEFEMEVNDWINFSLCISKNRNGVQGTVINIRMNKLSLKWEEIMDGGGHDR